MDSWNKGDLLRSKEYSYVYVIFISYNPENPDWFIGTDTDGITYEDWVVDKFERVRKANEQD